jgi:CRP-like cAMP-binding protein
MRETSLAPLTSRGWLATQPEAFRQWIADNGRWVHYSAGQLIYQAGDDPDGLYGLGEGALEITLPLTGEEPVTIYRAEPGFWIGESALLARTSRLITLEAAAASRVFRIPATAIRALVAERPEHWRPFFELSHLNVTTSVTLLAEALALTPRARLARMLLRLADDDDKVTARQDELARLIGMTRSSLQRALHSLGDAGAISGGYGCTLIRDRACLERISTEA